VLELKNVKTEQLRAELVKDFDFIVSAVTNMPDFVSWIKDKVKRKASMNCKMVFSISRRDLTEELKDFQKATQYDLADFFEDEFFETKKVVHVPLKFIS
jgi:16S rRNA (guanine527-N7)-methyltransferase